MARDEVEEALRRQRQEAEAGLREERTLLERQLRETEDARRRAERERGNLPRDRVDPAAYKAANELVAGLHQNASLIRKRIGTIDEMLRGLFRDLPKFATGSETARRSSKAEVFGKVAAAAHSLRGVQRQYAKNLLERMNASDFEYVYEKHRGGNREHPDWQWHITVRVNGTGYHLHVDARDVIWEITPPVPPLGGGAAPIGPKPHEKPGAHH